ncbi:GGDEF domain-containing protein [Pseudoalteromonas sp. MMG022]|uniref:GGDEF domain-containing protein n=1 Tax=Pseudoalteromonas sp. MMG022 TaxID=2909978 RepID=UPI001F408CEE|nr:GGDEF domain-containing protein [Pseudoalteromonas sp. MMG022]MCF6437313.1 GGDEF domain-containing protein [Pseudoalteromonas sp. MMG022]
MDHPHKKPNEVEQLKSQLLLKVAWYCLFLHAMLILVFLFVEVELLALFNIFSVATWWFGIKLLQKDYLSLALRIFSLEVTAHSIVVCLLIGTDYGFQFYLWAASCLLLLDIQLKLKQAVSWCTAIIIMFAYTYIGFIPSPYQIAYHEYAPYIHFLNVVVCGIPMIYTIGLIREITINQRKELEILAAHDSLTHLFNRRYALGLIHRAQQSCVSQKTPICVVMADIDHFKRVNDRYGHELGDEVIFRVSGQLKRHLNDADIGVRWGGEEFLLVLPNCSLIETQQRIENIRQAVEAMSFQADDLCVTMSFGIALWHPTQSFESVLKYADVALYNSKHKGRNTLTIAPESALT